MAFRIWPFLPLVLKSFSPNGAHGCPPGKRKSLIDSTQCRPVGNWLGTLKVMVIVLVELGCDGVIENREAASAAVGATASVPTAMPT